MSLHLQKCYNITVIYKIKNYYNRDLTGMCIDLQGILQVYDNDSLEMFK